MNCAAEAEKKKSKVDPVEVAARAAIIGPALANMGYGAMLNLYKASYDDPIERNLIE